MSKPVVGEIVHFVLTEGTAQEINRRRVKEAGHGTSWPAGAQAHVGNPVSGGEEVPMIIVAIWPNEFVDVSGQLVSGVNGQLILDGNDSFWITSVKYDETAAPGTWHCIGDNHV